MGEGFAILDSKSSVQLYSGGASGSRSDAAIATDASSGVGDVEGLSSHMACRYHPENDKITSMQTMTRDDPFMNDPEQRYVG